MYFCNNFQRHSDELTSFKENPLSLSDKKFLQREEVIVDYWIEFFQNH